MRDYENAHIVLWIFKDSCWVCSWRWLGMAMILPTLAVAIDIARRNRHDLSLIHILLMRLAQVRFLPLEPKFSKSKGGCIEIEPVQNRA